MSEFKRQHPVAAVSRVLSLIRENIVTIIILLFIGTSGSEGYFLYFLLGAMVLALAGGVMGWWMFRYRIQDDELQIRKGVFVKSKLYLSKDRIQVINITEGILQRMFGLVQLEVKTAGGGTQTATISAISREEAEALRKELRSSKNRNGNGEGQDEVLGAESVSKEEIQANWKLSNADLVKAAFTSGNFGLIASILGAVSGQLDEFINEETIEYIYEAAPGYSDITVLVGLVVAIIFISWLFSFLGVIFKYSNFEIKKKEDELIISSGLLERKYITVPFNRIQAVRFVEGLLREPLNSGMLYVESAGFDQNQKGRSIVLAPYIPSQNVQHFLHTFLEEYVPEGTAKSQFDVHPPKRALFRYIRRPLYFLMVAVPLLWFFFDYGWLAALLIPALAYLGWLRYSEAGAGTDGKLLMLRYRVLSRTTAMIQQNRIQDMTLSENPFQHRKSIKTLQVMAASGAGGIQFEIDDLDTKDAEKLLGWTTHKQPKLQQEEIH